MASINVQFRIHDTGEVECWILNEDGSTTYHYGMGSQHSQMELRLGEPIVIGAGVGLNGFRFTPFISKPEEI